LALAVTNAFSVYLPVVFAVHRQAGHEVDRAAFVITEVADDFFDAGRLLLFDVGDGA
jgi:hypothetical protein